nr:hypothetical protein [uncultured Roseateles sp.]
MKFLFALVVDVAFLAALYAWKVHGAEGARNLWIANMALHAFVGTVLLLASLSKTGPKDPPARAPRPLHLISVGLDIGATIVMVWFGHFFMAAIPLYARLGMVLYRDSFEKRAAAAKEASHG